MKHLLLLLFIAAAVSYCPAQTLTMDKVPAAAANAFKQKFPNGSQPSWSKEGNAFDVDFYNGKKPQSALFDRSGKWLETETQLNFGALPQKVQSTYEKEFEGYKVQETYEVESPEGITYSITAFKGNKNYEATFSDKGELLKKVQGEGDEDE